MSPASTTRRIAVAGAGPDGLAAALALARDGHDVHVFEKHPGLAPVGAGLLVQPQGLEALAGLGVLPAFEAASVPVTHLRGHSHRGWTIVDLDFSRRCARGVSRAHLADVLYGAAVQAGARFHFLRPILSARQAGRKVEVDTGADSGIGDAAFDACVLADGAASGLRGPTGLGAPSRPYAWAALWGQFTVPGWPHPQELLQRYHGTARMVGLLPTEMTSGGIRLSLFWSLRRESYEAWRASDLATWKRSVLELWPEAAPAVDQIRRHDDLANGRCAAA